VDEAATEKVRWASSVCMRGTTSIGASEEHVTVETQVGIDGHAKRLELRCNLQSASGNVEMSRPTSAVIILASAAAYTIFMTCSNAVSVECPRRYADCSRD